MNKAGLYQNSNNLEAYIEFLREEKFDDASHAYLGLIQASELPMLSFYLHLSPAELFLKVRDNLDEFFRNISEGTFLSSHSHKIDAWKSGLASHIPREKINK